MSRQVESPIKIQPLWLALPQDNFNSPSPHLFAPPSPRYMTTMTQHHTRFLSTPGSLHQVIHLPLGQTNTPPLHWQTNKHFFKMYFLLEFDPRSGSTWGKLNMTQPLKPLRTIKLKDKYFHNSIDWSGFYLELHILTWENFTFTMFRLLKNAFVTLSLPLE